MLELRYEIFFDTKSMKYQVHQLGVAPSSQDDTIEDALKGIEWMENEAISGDVQNEVIPMDDDV